MTQPVSFDHNVNNYMKALYWSLILTIGAACLAPLGRAESLNDVSREFTNPGPDLRGKPFWSWNGELKKDELLRQVRVLKQMGMGGFFMHSRTGLETEYLGEEWFKLINACADDGARRGMEAWLYDEDRWPSGTAGGLVTANPKFRQQFISLRMFPAAQFQWSDDLVAAFACKLDGVNYTSCQRLARGTAVPADQTVLAFTIETMEKSSFFNDYTDVDRLSREATQEFIKLTHEKYREKCGDRLGKSIKGIFTDEPHRGSVMTGFSLSNTNRLRMAPWTGELPARFKQSFGYDLVDRLPELFLRKDGAAIAQVKWQYMDLLQQMFLDNWAAPIRDWCHTNHMIFTGHVLHEDSLTCQSAMQGSLMRFYEYMDYPGVDVLTEGNRGYWIVKQLSSAARQLGQKTLLSELYGVTGWQFNFESHKAVGDWQALFGINLRCQHLSWYTMGGEAKRDYPASIFYQSGWWPDYHYVEDYFSRLHLLLKQGEPQCDVLVLNPVESVWCQVGVGWCDGLSPQTREIQELEGAYTEVFHWLASSQIDFDYGDEEMMSRLARVEKDAAGKPLVRFGKAAYRVVVVPKMTTMRASSVKLLDAFVAAGGQVVFVGDAPAYVDALKSSQAAELSTRARKVAWNGGALVEACRPALSAPVEVADAKSGKPAGDIFCQLRSASDASYLVAMNMSRDQAHNGLRIRVKHTGDVAEWNCRTGERYRIASTTQNGWTEFIADFPPVGEHAYVLTAKPMPGLGVQPVREELERVPMAGPFAYELNEPNVCVLDMARYQINDEPWQAETEILKIDQAVRRFFKMPLRGGEMVQPWFSKKFEGKPDVKGRLKMVFEVVVEEQPEQQVTLALEEPQSFDIAINGKKVTLPKTDSWWIDPAIKTVPLPRGLLVRGTNNVELACGFRRDINLEAAYLLGKFGVRIAGTQKTLTRLPEKLAVGDVTSQGLPFYSGGITYRLPVLDRMGRDRTAFVQTPKFEAACVKVKMGKRSERYIAWQPYEAEVSEAARSGQAVELQVVLTRRNTFGPLHLVPKNSGAYGPGHWLTEGGSWSQEYQLWPAGLLESPVVVYKTAGR